jgi:hypothetical protein
MVIGCALPCTLYMGFVMCRHGDFVMVFDHTARSCTENFTKRCHREDVYEG